MGVRPAAKMLVSCLASAPLKAPTPRAVVERLPEDCRALLDSSIAPRLPRTNILEGYVKSALCDHRRSEVG
jgi:hypothetical protein